MGNSHKMACPGMTLAVDWEVKPCMTFQTNNYIVQNIAHLSCHLPEIFNRQKPETIVKMQSEEMPASFQQEFCISSMI